MEKDWIIGVVILVALSLLICFCVENTNALYQEIGADPLGTEIKLPILMYHSVDETGSPYSVSETMLKEHIKVLLDEGFTTVNAEEVASWVNGNGSLPENPVLITFDDGYQNNFEKAFPILKTYNAKAVMFVVGSTIGKDTYVDGLPMTPHFTLEQLMDMENSGLIDVQCHTYNMHQVGGRDTYPARVGVTQKTGETEDAYRLALKNDINEFKEVVFAPMALAYPHGKYTDIAEEVFRSEGIEMTFTTVPEMNTIVKGDANTIRLLGRIDADTLTAQEVIEFCKK